MTITDSKTIFALATSPGKAGVGVVRISGDRAYEALTNLTKKKEFLPRRALVSNLYNPISGLLIDKALVIYFKAPISFTGEDVVEFHVHGSPAVYKILYDALKSVGLRVAEPGEFSRRAFMNGKMDLTQAEGLADLIEAETEVQHRQALRQMEGELGIFYENLRKEIINIMAFIEAYIDFPDEDIPLNITNNILKKVSDIRNKILSHLSDNKRGERIREGINVTIIGAPNVGKSTLMNYLSKRDVAIVSDIPGTTRDAIEAYLNINGYPVVITDTAGIRESSDIIEKEGVKRSKQRAKTSDIKIIMFDATSKPDNNIKEFIEENDIIVVNKSDLTSPKGFPENAIEISLKTGAGLEKLVSALNKVLESIFPTQNLTPTRLRHRELLELAESNLNKVIEDFGKIDITLIAEELRLASRTLAKITGKIDIEDILDEIFKEFCIGK